MKFTKICVLLCCVAFISGCGKPPKDVARKMTLDYVISMGGEDLQLEDIKYLSAYAKDGGYTVNMQAGEALCEMPMIKGEKEWMAKGINCNGSFLTGEKKVERRKERMKAKIKSAVEEGNAKPYKNADGLTITNSLDGKRYAMVIKSDL